MIGISKLDPDKDVGRWVEYKDFRGVEKGRIKFWTDKYVFVVYKCADQWHRFADFTAAATRPEDLNFIAAPDLSQAKELIWKSSRFKSN